LFISKYSQLKHFNWFLFLVKILFQEKLNQPLWKAFVIDGRLISSDYRSQSAQPQAFFFEFPGVLYVLLVLTETSLLFFD